MLMVSNSPRLCMRVSVFLRFSNFRDWISGLVLRWWMLWSEHLTWDGGILWRSESHAGGRPSAALSRRFSHDRPVWDICLTTSNTKIPDSNFDVETPNKINREWMKAAHLRLWSEEEVFFLQKWSFRFLVSNKRMCQQFFRRYSTSLF
jgi:hypothetical protein